MFLGFYFNTFQIFFYPICICEWTEQKLINMWKCAWRLDVVPQVMAHASEQYSILWGTVMQKGESIWSYVQEKWKQVIELVSNMDRCHGWWIIS